MLEKLKNIKHKLNDNPDITVRVLDCGDKQVGLIFFKSMIDKNLFINGLISPIMEYSGDVTIQILKTKVLKVVEVETITEMDKIVDELTKNKILIFVSGEKNCLSIDLESYPTRTPDEPPTSPTIQGPREGFTENIKTNTSLIRKKFPTKNLVIEKFDVGDLTNTVVEIFYLKNVVDKSIVKEIKSKLKKIDIDGIIDSHYIATLLQSRPNSLFEQFGTCEKPDIVAAKMLEGRIAIVVDGSPIVLTIPFMFFEDVQNSNDYYTNSHYVTYIRFIRAVGLILATVVPGAYLAVRLYHYNIVAENFIITIANSTQNLPFTPFLELLFILILFQVLYEVSLRLPRYLGLATSIVGALILGDTGVKAGLISPPGTIVVALSIISIYTIPNQAPQLTILRFVFLLLGATVGLLGIIGGMIYIINYLTTLNDFNTPYLAPYAPHVEDDLKDGLKMKPLTAMEKRPKSISNINHRRLRK